MKPAAVDVGSDSIRLAVVDAAAGDSSAVSARTASDTLAGIRPAGVPGFVVAQLLGAAATLLFRRLVPSLPAEAAEVVIPHGAGGRKTS